jgi:hypothetical protein
MIIRKVVYYWTAIPTDWHRLGSRIELGDATVGRWPDRFSRPSQLGEFMMDRTWSVEIAGKKHLIEVDYGRNTSQTGKLLVDGNELQSWKNAQHLDVPPEITFEVGGKPAVLRAKGFFKPRIDLFFEGQLIETSLSQN